MDTFGSKDGFAVAAGITNFVDGDSTTLEKLEDLSIGQVKFFVKSWGKDAISGEDDLFLELESRDCLESDFNDVEGTNKDSMFYPIDYR